MNDSDLLDQRDEGHEATALAITDRAPRSYEGSDSAEQGTTGAAPTERPVRRRASRPVGATAAAASEPAPQTASAGGGLAAKLLPELQQIAGNLGIAGVARLRKGQLISAIQEARNGAAAAISSSNGASSAHEPAADTTAAPESAAQASTNGSAHRSTQRSERAAGGNGEATASGTSAASGEDGQGYRRERPDRVDRSDRSERPERTDRGYQNTNRPRNNNSSNYQGNNGASNGSANGSGQSGQNPNPRAAQAGTDDSRDDDDLGSARGRRGRYRDRRRGRDRVPGNNPTTGGDVDTTIREDDVLAPVAGILDTSDNYAFLRTSGYLAGPNDVYVSMNLVRRHGLRRGDAITGQVRANATESEQQGNRREKYNPLVRLDTVNGVSPEESKSRPEFTKLVPLYPQERLRLETEPGILTTRVIDLVMPIGKGQRALIVSPPKAGKTMVLQAIANAITVNNPECHLMVVLVDERPEEVTDMQRSVKGEVIASTFDRPAQDHTTVAELSIERAKRLVELGHDVVVLLDSITRLGRAYNLAAPASGRILSGGVDSTALYPPKRFLGAARNIENGGSLTILATALVETGSQMDTVIFEEFKGTGNAELKLDRKIADKRVFPAVDIDPSGTRKEDLLMSAEEMAIVHKLRRVLHSLDSQAAIDLLVDKLKHTQTNIEFLMQIAKTAPGQD